GQGRRGMGGGPPGGWGAWGARQPERERGRGPAPAGGPAAPAEGRGGGPVAVAGLGGTGTDLHAALRLAAHDNDELGGRAGLAAQALVRDDQRGSWAYHLGDALGCLLG